ncbi:MAG: AMP-binding protein [Steroidobacteraceae bacterium]
MVRSRAAEARGLRAEGDPGDARSAIRSGASRCSRTAAPGPGASASRRYAKLPPGLQQLGVCKGDRVMAWLPSGPQIVLTWFAANYLGAVFVPLNTAYRGAILEHVLNSAAGAVLVAHGGLLERLGGSGAAAPAPRDRRRRRARGVRRGR